jgi:hypothetical membrane protein
MPYTTILLIICCAALFYRIGESDYNGGALLALASVALWLLGSYALGFGWMHRLLRHSAIWIPPDASQELFFKSLAGARGSAAWT